MKKLLPFFLMAFVSLFIYSCDNNDDVVVQPGTDTYPVAYDINNAVFTRNTDYEYVYNKQFTNALVESDMVLIYMHVGDTNNNSPIWKLLPYTIYTQNNDPIECSFDFSKFDFAIYINSTLNLTNNMSYVNGNNFRLVVIPASTGQSAKAAAPVDYKDYNSVIKYYNIDESKIKAL
ncbi:hypothetical protein [Chryseobacterium sp. CT-SW4]|uniref:hypothetical protein n=1 Tax=Chryseobacterium sp. SW-1 TaxID=3157343 RepID=UPI003B02E537